MIGMNENNPKGLYLYKMGWSLISDWDQQSGATVLSQTLLMGSVCGPTYEIIMQ